MSEIDAAAADHEPSGHYEIRLKGYLSDKWAEWFEGLTITLAENGETWLAGPVADQAALHGLLKRVRDLGLPLISVMRVNPKPPSASASGADGEQNRR